MKTLFKSLWTASFIAISFVAQAADIDAFLGKDVKIENGKSGKALTVENASLDNGASIVQEDFNGSDNQVWVIEQLEAGRNRYKITNKASGKALEIKDAGTENGDIARQWDFFDVDHHKWEFLTGSQGRFKILNRNSAKVIEVADGSTANGATVRQWESFSVDHHEWSVSEVGVTQSEYVVQAEAATLTGGAVESDGNAEGGSYFNLQSDGRVDVAFSVPANGTYAVKFRYRSPYGDKTQILYDNDSYFGEQVFSDTSDWTDLEVFMSFNAGNNTVSVAASWGYSHIDQITIVGGEAPTSGNPDPDPAPVATLYEAESAAQSGEVDTQTGQGSSSGQYVQINATGSITFSINVESAGDYDLKFASWSPWGNKKQNLYIDNVYQGELSFDQSESWEIVTAQANLSAGSHSIRIETGWGWTRFDYLEVLPTGTTPTGPAALYYDSYGFVYDFVEREGGECFTSPGDSPTPCYDYFTGQKNGAWVIERTFREGGTVVSVATFNLETGVVTEDGVDYAPGHADYKNKVKATRPNYELEVAQAYVDSVAALY